MAEPGDVVSENIVASIAAMQQRAEASGDDSGQAMSTGEKKLLLRHRDSFMVTKSHQLDHGGGGRGVEKGARATVAGLYSANGLTEALREGADAAAQAPVGEEGGDVLEGLEEMTGHQRGGSGGEGAALDADFGSPGGGAQQASSPSSGTDESPRKKNRLFSFVKGVATVLGLRASKKKRAAAAGGGAGGGASPTGLAGARPSFSSPQPSGASLGSPRGGSFAGDASGSAFGEDYEPLTDETGSYVPSHRTLPTPRSILRTGPDGSPRPSARDYRASSAAAAGGAGGDPEAQRAGASAGSEGSSATGDGLSSPSATGRGGYGQDDPSGLASGRRGLSFADQHGHDLELVKYSERLHYSVASEHVQGEESSRSCSIM